MIVQRIANSQNDEFYTPLYAVKPIEKYIKPGSKIWCPFDTENSLFVKEFSRKGFYVLGTHLDDGDDFFDLINSDICDWCDYIISNPPYSLKTEVLKALFESEKPFAMLLGIVGLFESQRRFEMFRDNEFEIMYMNRRIDYFKDFNEIKPSKNPPFSSVYLTHKILPQQIVFEGINKQDIKIDE